MFAMGSKVAWTTASGVHGRGKIISSAPVSFEDGTPHLLVAVDAPPDEEHRVIYCAQTWLTPIPDGKK